MARKLDTPPACSRLAVLYIGLNRREVLRDNLPSRGSLLTSRYRRGGRQGRRRGSMWRAAVPVVCGLMAGWAGAVGTGCSGDDDRRDAVKGFRGGKRAVGGSIDRRAGSWGPRHRRDGDISGRLVALVHDHDASGDVGRRPVAAKNYWSRAERTVVRNKALCSDVMPTGYVSRSNELGYVVCWKGRSTSRSKVAAWCNEMLNQG